MPDQVDSTWSNCDLHCDGTIESGANASNPNERKQSNHHHHHRSAEIQRLERSLDQSTTNRVKCPECYEYRSEHSNKRSCPDGDQQSSHWDDWHSYGEKWLDRQLDDGCRGGDK